MKKGKKEVKASPKRVAEALPLIGFYEHKRRPATRHFKRSDGMHVMIKEKERGKQTKTVFSFHKDIIDGRHHLIDFDGDLFLLEGSKALGKISSTKAREGGRKVRQKKKQTTEKTSMSEEESDRRWAELHGA